MSRVAVLGGGGFALAAAAHLALEDHEVTILLHAGARGATTRAATPTIRLHGALGEREAVLERVTADPSEAVPGRAAIVFAAPGAWYEDSARLVAPYLEDGQLVLVNQGLVGVALRVAHALAATRATVRVLIGEMAGQAYMVGEPAAEGKPAGNGPGAGSSPSEVEVFLVSKPTLFAGMPSEETAEALAVASQLYPGLTPAQNVLETSLSSVAAILYPPPVLLNVGTIQRSGRDFSLFEEGVTPAVAELMRAADEERMILVRSLGFGAVGLLDWLAQRGHVSRTAAEAHSFYEAFHAGEPLRDVKAPASLEDHTFLDAVGSGLVPLAELGQLLGLGTPVIDALITMGSLVTGRSYRTVGVTLDRMGLPGEPWKLKTFLETGRR